MLCVTAPCVTVSKARRSRGAHESVLAVGEASVESHLAAIRGAIMTQGDRALSGWIFAGAPRG